MKCKLAILMALFLMVAISASAAPTRDLTEQALLHQDIAARVQPLVDAVAAVAIDLNLTVFRNETQPEPALVQGLLYQSLYNRLQVVETIDGKAFLRFEDANALAGQLFLAETPALDPQTVTPGVLAMADGLQFDLELSRDFIGAAIYDVQLSEDELVVKADIYTLEGIVASAEEAPEDALTWLGHLGVRLVPDTISPVGFSLASFSVPERYQPAAMVQFVQENLFELQYPDIFSVQTDLENTYLSLSTQDGSATLTVRSVPGTLESLKAVWLKDHEGKEPVTALEEDMRLLLTKDGVVRLAYYNPLEGEDSCLVLEMTYPTLKVHEYELYQTFLDNSFVVYSHSVG
ncbi:MAG: hypothetical protein GX171_07315 [Clostridiales bacterium]|jgi:hypothetical protein|nr:hypothetical protein [Clostridiales bacterium]